MASNAMSIVNMQGLLFKLC